MADIFEKTIALLGERAFEKLKKSTVAVVGLGGVGSYAVEAIVRAGLGRVVIVDHDKVDLTNINRQLIALSSTIGRYKTEVTKNRMLDINPAVEIVEKRAFLSRENIDAILDEKVDYVIDAVDTVTAKLALAEWCTKRAVPVISSMGTGNKLSPESFRVADIFKTTTDPLAKIMRRELKKRGIDRLLVVYSKEEPKKARITGRRDGVLASISFVPGACGLLLAAHVVKTLAFG